MNTPITKIVQQGGQRRACGCCGACSCGNTPAKNMAYAAIKAANEGKETFTYAGEERKVTAQKNSAVKMWGPAKRKYGEKNSPAQYNKKNSPARKGCGSKK